jgi:hypothetical protein
MSCYGNRPFAQSDLIMRNIEQWGLHKDEGPRQLRALSGVA